MLRDSSTKDLNRICFFCGEVIEGKKTREHIVPNSLLGKLGLKEVTISGQKEVQYSRIKVPAHSSCNNEFGSQYEETVIQLLENTDYLYESLRSEENSRPMIYMACESPAAIITTWLSKLYYGIFYYDYLTSEDSSWKLNCWNIISSRNFDFVRKSYKNGHGFQLPSSLYFFKTKNTETDLVTIIDPSSILIKIGALTIILCICDGYLTRNYLNGETLDRLRGYVAEQEEIDIEFPAHKLAFAEILALRACIPKRPSFSYTETQIFNNSFSTMALNPDEAYAIDANLLNEARKEIYNSFNIEFDISS
jgi:hypothetical protein